MARLEVLTGIGPVFTLELTMVRWKAIDWVTGFNLNMTVYLYELVDNVVSITQWLTKSMAYLK